MEENRPITQTPEQALHEQELPQQEAPQQELPEQEKPVYRPRPRWQLWAARIGAGIMLLAFLLYCLHIAGFGL